MGDADISQLMTPVLEELEDLLDGTLSVVNERIHNRLLLLLTLLHAQTLDVANWLVSWQKFRRCFNALNLFVVPLMLAFLISYSAAGVVEPDSAVETCLEATIMFLLYLSGIIGFPLYLISLWKANVSDDHVKDIRTIRKMYNKTEDRESVPDIVGEISIADVVESFERISDFRKLVSRSSSDSSGINHERTGNQYGQRQQESSPTTEVSDVNTVSETPENYDGKEVLTATQKLVDLDFDILSKMDVPVTETSRSGLLLEARNDPYDLQVIILNAREDLSVKVEKNDESVEIGKTAVPEENRLSPIAKNRLPALRDIPVENIAEGDNGNRFFRGNY